MATKTEEDPCPSAPFTYRPTHKWEFLPGGAYLEQFRQDISRPRAVFFCVWCRRIERA